MYLFGSDNGVAPTVTVTRTSVSGNRGEPHGGGVYIITLGGQGGSIKVSLDECTINNNQIPSGTETARYGGGLFFFGSAEIDVSNSDISGNIGPIGGAVCVSSAQQVQMRNCSFRDYALDSMVLAYIDSVQSECPLGRYMPAKGTFYYPGDFNTCIFECPAGNFGDSPTLRSAMECTICTAGYYCEGAGLSKGTPCPTGTRMPGIGARSVESCFPCGPGRFNDQVGQTTCTPCAAGTYTEVDDAESCSACPSGGFCPTAGATSKLVFQPCPGGSYNEGTGADSSNACIGCPAGTSNPVPGSSSSADCTKCLPGSAAPTPGHATCSLCAAGKFTPDFGSTSCGNCTEGYLCVEGSSAPQPCPGGTHANQAILTIQGYLSNLTRDCIGCAPGTFCPVGSAIETPCAPGTRNPNEKQERCTPCDGGTYQDGEGDTACKACKEGSYCPQGAVS